LLITITITITIIIISSSLVQITVHRKVQQIENTETRSVVACQSINQSEKD